jgi:hypothetical protein
MSNDEFTKVFGGIIDASKQLNKSWAYSDTNLNKRKDNRNELVCLALYDDGWIQDGFDHIPNSNSIITYWKKDGEVRREVMLTIEQQRRWVNELDKRGKKK